MRLWSIHPKYLDTMGLLGLWREALLAQEVLKGKTEKYKNHPQLIRFKNQKEHSLLFISAYLWEIYKEARNRKYNFIWQKIWKHSLNIPEWVYGYITITKGQLEFEFKHLQNKLNSRGQLKMIENYNLIDKNNKIIEVNSLFEITEGDIENWEKIK